MAKAKQQKALRSCLQDVLETLSYGGYLDDEQLWELYQQVKGVLAETKQEQWAAGCGSSEPVPIVASTFIDELLESAPEGRENGHRPLGVFLTYDVVEELWVACDNSTGAAWVEEFKTLGAALLWLKGERSDA